MKSPLLPLSLGILCLSSCSTTAPREVPRERLMHAVAHDGRGAESFHYIGTTPDAVYLEHLRLTMLGEQREIWASPRKDFSRRDFKTLEKSRR